jgi:hypothetical protein
MPACIWCQGPLSHQCIGLPSGHPVAAVVVIAEKVFISRWNKSQDCRVSTCLWLIDSIVKASSAGITLPTDPTDHKPLFRSSSDSANNNSDDNKTDGDVIAMPAKHDIEAQGLVKKLRQLDNSSHTHTPSLNSLPLSMSSVHRTSLSLPPALRSILSV